MYHPCINESRPFLDYGFSEVLVGAGFRQSKWFRTKLIHVSIYVSHMYYDTSHFGCPGGVGSRVASRPTLYLIHVFQMYIHLETVVETRHRVIHLRNTCIMCRRKLTSTGGTQMHTARALIHVCHRSCNHNTCITNVSRCRGVDTCINIVYHRRYMLAHSPSCSMVSHVESSHDAR